MKTATHAAPARTGLVGLLRELQGGSERGLKGLQLTQPNGL